MPLETDSSVSAPNRPRIAGQAGWPMRGLAVSAAWIATFIWAATIYWFSSRTGPQIEEINIFELSDKAAHFIAFFAGGPPLVCALRWSTNWSWRRVAWVAALLLALYGATDEYHQTFTVNRTGADFWDGLADGLGGLAGAFATTFFYARLERSRIPRPPTP